MPSLVNLINGGVGYLVSVYNRAEDDWTSGLVTDADGPYVSNFCFVAIAQCRCAVIR